MSYIPPPLINDQYKKRLDGFYISNYNNELPTTHGGAKWQKHHELIKSELIGDTGIPLGISTPSWFYKQNLTNIIRYTGKKHLVTIAPNGSGKGTDVQIPVLLEHDASIFMIDPKGENTIITAHYRKTVLKQDVFILNPFGVLEDEFKERDLTCHGFNPLTAP